ncbi:AhpC/TSA family protein [Vibrio sp. 1-Bac 57]
MTTLKQQTEAKVEAGRKGNPDFMAGVDQVIAQAKSFQQGKDALDVGKNAPNFELPDAQGKSISLADLLIKGPVVITFYRGSWCPYCNLQLKALQAQLADIQALGATLVAISPQIPDGSLTADEINNMGFTVLSDQDAKVAAEYGVAWQVPEFLLDHMRNDRQLDLEAINNGNANIIPIPATFILNSDGEVTWRFVDLDYRIRSEPSDIIEALQKL